MKLLARLIIASIALGMAVTAFAQEHPAYLQALSDLRASRWLLEHVPGDWQRVKDEIRAVQKIDDAINVIKKAAIDDGKDLSWHPAVQEKTDHPGRLHDALDLLRKARLDINQEEDNRVAKGLRSRASRQIREAIRLVEAAISVVK